MTVCWLWTVKGGLGDTVSHGVSRVRVGRFKITVRVRDGIMNGTRDGRVIVMEPDAGC